MSDKLQVQLAEISQRCDALRRSLSDPSDMDEEHLREIDALIAFPYFRELWAAMRRHGGPVPPCPDFLNWNADILRRQKARALRGEVNEDAFYHKMLKSLDEIAAWIERKAETLKETGKSAKEKMSLDARAVALLVENPDRKKKEIAALLNVSTQSICPQRCPRLAAAMRAHTTTLPRGAKDKEGNLEAFDEDE